MPPICLVCRARPSADEGYDRFTVVYFRPTERYEDGWTGHPENAEWFCAAHLPLTEGLTGLTAGEAWERITARAAAPGDDGGSR